MNTKRLYQDDVYLETTSAQITELYETEEETLIATDKTVFFPEGGGQPSDIGFLNDYPVCHVREKNNLVYHKIKGKTNLKTGDTVNLEINRENRFKNMQAHLGEHILSGVFNNLYGGVNRGFHMGENYITIDIALEKDPSYTEITWEMALTAENAANEIIWSNLPVTTYRFTDKKKASAMKLRKELTVDADDISIVTVGDVKNPKDCVACCGTHPKTSAEVGLVKIYKVEKNKGMFRIYFDCGIRAMKNYDKLHDTFTRISDKYSAGLNDMEEKLSKEEQKNTATRAKLSALIKTLAKSRAEELENLSKDKYEAGMAESPVVSKISRVIYKKYSDFSTDDILKIDKELKKAADKLYALLSVKDMTVVLISDGNINCGELVKNYANFYSGKGGGKPTLARAIFQKESDVDMFVDLLEKHLR